MNEAGLNGLSLSCLMYSALQTCLILPHRQKPNLKCLVSAVDLQRGDLWGQNVIDAEQIIVCSLEWVMLLADACMYDVHACVHACICLVCPEL